MSPFLLLAASPPVGIELDPTLAMMLAFLFVLLNGFFVAAEFALVKVRPTQIELHAVEGHRRARVAQHMITHLDAYLSATQLGITLASLALGWIGEPAFARILEPLLVGVLGASPAVVHTVSLTVAFAVITVLHIVLGELAPKSLAIRKPEPTSLLVAIPLYAFYKVSYPAIWVLNHAANGILRIFGIQPVTESELAHSEEEIRRLLASEAQSELPEHKRELLANVFELSHRTARQIMVPRADVVYLSTTRPMNENLEVARRAGHTRFPLCEGDLDHVVGLVHIKDLFRAPEPSSSLTDVRRAISFVPETMPADRLLRRMRAERVHMAAVLDEYGGVSGIVTLENVIEEIVGEIQDEFDFEKPEIVPLGSNAYQVSGQMLVADLEDELDLELSERDEDTIGGVVLSELGRRGRVGDVVRIGHLALQVLEIDGNRIRTLRLTVETPAVVAPEVAGGSK
jgi:CBS domain containing-hemolysin-like protein